MHVVAFKRNYIAKEFNLNESVFRKKNTEYRWSNFIRAIDDEWIVNTTDLNFIAYGVNIEIISFEK